MKKVNSKFLFATIASIATIIATAVSTSACYYFLYQPKEPISLRDE